MPDAARRAYLRDGHVLLPGVVEPGALATLEPEGAATRLGEVAAVLLGASSVRVVGCRLERAPARTPIGSWQRDAGTVGVRGPLTTMWLPLQATDVDLGPPQYASGTVTQETSDQFLAGHASDPSRTHPIDTRYVVTGVEPMAAGDAWFRGGWTAYRLFGNVTDGVRRAAVVTWRPA